MLASTVVLTLVAALAGATPTPREDNNIRIFYHDLEGQRYCFQAGGVDNPDDFSYWAHCDLDNPDPSFLWVLLGDELRPWNHQDYCLHDTGEPLKPMLKRCDGSRAQVIKVQAIKPEEENRWEEWQLYFPVSQTRNPCWMKLGIPAPW